MKKRIILWMLITPLGLILLLVASWYTFCFWVDSWRNIEPLPCHESWSQEQCADLMEIDNELRNNSAIAGLTFFYEGELSPTTKWLREKKWGMIPAMLLGRRELCVPARAALHETMRSGKGDIQLPSGIPVADFALKFHKTELLKELIRRGANPNHVYVAWTAAVETTNGGQSNLIWETFDGIDLSFEKHLTPAARLELLDFMLAHGGSVATVPNSTLAELYMLLPLCQTKDSDKGLATAWALRHGMPVSDQGKQNCINFLKERNPELLLELQKEHLLPTEEMQAEDTDREE